MKEKKDARPVDRLGQQKRRHLGHGLPRRVLVEPSGFASALHGWAEEGEPLRLVRQSVAKDDPDPKAVSCYGLYLSAAV